MSPIRESERSRYPSDWKAISRRIRFERAGGTCECTGQCGSDHSDRGGRCHAQHGRVIVRNLAEGHRWLTSDEWEAGERTQDDWTEKAFRVVLTTAHLDHTPENCAEENLLALCQRCHLRLDRELHQRTARETRRSRRAVGDLPGLEDPEVVDA